MPVKWTPTGSLDVTTNASLLPASTDDDGKTQRSGAMRRATNIRIDETGIARTRFGSTKGSTAIHAANRMIELSGNRYEFGGDEIYRDEASLITGLTDAAWSAAIAKAYNGTTDAIFAINGTDRKRIESGGVAEWGITAPTTGPALNANYRYAITYSWENDHTLTSTSISACDALTSWAVTGGDSTLSLTTSGQREGTGCVKVATLSTDPTMYAYAYYDNGAGGVDYSTAKYFGFWLGREDTSETYTQVYYFKLIDAAGKNAIASFPKGTNYAWTHIDIPLTDLIQDSGFSWTTVRYIYIGWVINEPNFNRSRIFWIDDLRYSATNVVMAAVKYTKNYDDSYEYVYSWEDDHLADEEIIPVSNKDMYAMWVWERGNTYNGAKYNIKYTYARKEDTLLLYESNPSTADAVTEINGVNLSWATPSDPQITHIRVYRTEINGDTYYFDSEWLITDLNAFISTTDDELGSIITEDNDRPPLGSIVAGPLNGSLFIAHDNLLYFSKANQPELWPALYYIEVSPPHQPIKALCIWSGLMYALTEFNIYQIQGTSPSTYFPIRCNALTGAKNQDGVIAIPDAGLIHVGNDGIYLWTSIGDTNMTREAFNVLFYATNGENVPYVYETYLSRCFFLRYKDKVYFFYPEATDSYPSNLLVFDMQAQRTIHYEFGTQFTTGCIDHTNDRLYVCDSSGYIWQLENESATTDNSTAISWQVQSKAFADPLYKYFPRYAKYDVTVGSGGTAQGDILLNETSKQAHTLTGTRNTRKRLITGCTGDRLSVRISGTGTVTIYGAEVE